MLIVYIFLLVFVLSLIFWQYEAIVIRRFIITKKISRLCKEKDLNFKVINKLYPFSNNKRDEFDFVLRIDKTVIPVKLFSAVSRKSTIIIDHLGKICIVKGYRKPLSRDNKKQMKTLRIYGAIPKMKISKRIVGDRYTCFPIILNEPKFERVLYRDKQGNILNFYEGTRQVMGCSFVDSKILTDLIDVYKGMEL